MRKALLVAMFGAALNSCTSPTANLATSPPPPAPGGGNVVMNFTRDATGGPACLQYSWVPTGQRHNILLRPGQLADSQPLTLSSNAALVQICRLTNNAVGTHDENWNFPMPAPGPAATGALVSITGGKATLTVHYANGQDYTDTRPLKPSPLPCP
jgi:hypothetical protein